MHAAGAAPIPNAEQLMRRWFDEVWNQGRESSISELMADDSIFHGIVNYRFRHLSSNGNFRRKFKARARLRIYPA